MWGNVFATELRKVYITLINSFMSGIVYRNYNDPERIHFLFLSSLQIQHTNHRDFVCTMSGHAIWRLLIHNIIISHIVSSDSTLWIAFWSGQVTQSTAVAGSRVQSCQATLFLESQAVFDHVTNFGGTSVKLFQSF